MKVANKTFNLFLCFTLLFSGCATTQNQTHRPSPASALHQQQPASSDASAEELEIGKQIHQQILASFYPYTDPKVVNYVNRVGNSLTKFADRKNLPYHFTILYNEKIYATSAPGGYIYVTTGMMNFLKSEAELAAVLAHEIGQLQYHDPRLSQGRKILDSVTESSAMVGTAFGEIGALAVLGLVLMQAIAKAGDLTPEERLQDADRRAMEYMVKAGYDPQGMFDFLYGFLNKDERIAAYFYDYYQSRPITMERMKNLEQVFMKLPLQGKTLRVNRETYQEITKGIGQMYRP